DLLDLAKVEAGQFEFEFEDLDAVETVTRCLKFVARTATERSIDLQVKNAPSPSPKVRADSRALRQMVLNLLSNAIKFTPQGGEVNIEIRQEDDGAVTIAVSDTGIGLSNDEQRRVFEPFSRGSYAIASQAEGVGLGLALVRSMMVRHGGTVSVQSTRGEGTTFILRFPAPGFVKRRPRMQRRTMSPALESQVEAGGDRS
ncbi:MAG: HAMP domain-containing histidine kinase, partial [Rhodospirillaceae bacterium]|nr:HAMP domain-containing histidine kinase [Rhodospirillaceae bacterium]